ncbi:MAG TPA: L,D-transpeptidase [Actinospica sp.]|nr:L,D-transpeptidase [Actinospica sp.]
MLARETQQPERFPGRPGRRALAAVVAVVLLALLALSTGSAAAAPNDVGPDRVYFPQTGHYLAYGFLDYWHHHGDVAIFGYPISEELTENGMTVQYFERAVFEYHPNAPAGWKVQLQRLGAEQTAGRVNETAFKPIVAADDASTTFYPQTGHTLAFGFRAYWQDHGGLAVFGYPISQEFTENGLTVQYFERARFEYHPNNPPGWQVLLGRLGATAARQADVNTARLAQTSSVAAYDPGLWTTPAPPSPPAPSVSVPAGAPTSLAKWVEVNLSTQYLRAWEYSTPVFGTYVSTGIPGLETPTGTFHIYEKLRYDDMAGGSGASAYYLPDVPYVMYFYEAYALHGTYWHHNFGTPMSHGCVNLPTDAAGWVYDWAPLGTTVWIHY